MRAQAGIQVFPQHISGFPPSRLGRNLQTRKMSLFVIPGFTRNPALFQSVAVLDAGSSPA
jgi:hypothetical protein